MSGLILHQFKILNDLANIPYVNLLLTTIKLAGYNVISSKRSKKNL